MASKKDRDQAWNNARKLKSENPDVWRQDDYGNKIRKASYGTKGEFGWEIDHKNPKSKGGSDAPKNIQVIHWKENREKGDKYPY